MKSVFFVLALTFSVVVCADKCGTNPLQFGCAVGNCTCQQTWQDCDSNLGFCVGGNCTGACTNSSTFTGIIYAVLGISVILIYAIGFSCYCKKSNKNICTTICITILKIIGLLYYILIIGILAVFINGGFLGAPKWENIVDWILLALLIALPFLLYGRYYLVHKMEVIHLQGVKYSDEEIKEKFGGILDVFISYQWNTQDAVIKINDALKQEKLTTWMDIGKMGGGDDFLLEMEKGIRAAKVVVVCLTKDYLTSKNCRSEIILAHKLDKFIIPLLISDGFSWPPEGLGTVLAEKLYIDFRDSYNDSATFDVCIKKLIHQIKNYIEGH